VNEIVIDRLAAARGLADAVRLSFAATIETRVIG
jgi:hypothetical protein